jgi:hypothetical protein
LKKFGGEEKISTFAPALREKRVAKKGKAG